MMTDASLFAVFMTGMLGGVHCAGMCGGIVSALSLLGRRQPASTLSKSVSVPVSSMGRPGALASASTAHAANGASAVFAAGTSSPFSALGTQLSTSLYYNVGRIGMYTTLGFVVGSLGSLSFLLEHALPVQQFAYFSSSVLLILMGVYLAGVKRVATVIESLGEPVWKRIKPLAVARMRRGSGPINMIATGALWGLVPCGMVYGVLTMTLLAGSGLRGAMLMLAFGMGTLPNLLALGVAGGALRRATANRWIRRCAAAVIIAFGVIGLLRVQSIAAHVNDLPLLRDLCRVVS